MRAGDETVLMNYYLSVELVRTYIIIIVSFGSYSLLAWPDVAATFECSRDPTAGVGKVYYCMPSVVEGDAFVMT